MRFDYYVQLREQIKEGNAAKLVLGVTVKEVWQKICKFSQPFVVMNEIYRLNKDARPIYINSDLTCAPIHSFSFNDTFSEVELVFEEHYDNEKYFTNFPVQWLYETDEVIQAGVEKIWNDFLTEIRTRDKVLLAKREQQERETYERLKTKFG
jgi:hypothetical protein